jgi:D-alanyl-D-alanine carboxypeptidase/D-alanyl-D-alanine-endopeptidase (penicillin-binding protein 4)
MCRKLIAAILLVSLSLPAYAAPPAAVAAAEKKQKVRKLRTLSYKEIAKRVDKFLAAPELQRGFFGIHVVDAQTGKTVYEVNADRLFTPASNTKLFTTATALAMLGPQYRVETTVETNGAVEPNGTLKGDLFLVGRGDPNLSGRVLPYNGKTERQTPHLRVLEQLADTIVAAGVREVDGDVVGDDSAYAYERYGAGWGQDDLMWSDGAPASALTINDNSIFVTVAPGNVGEPAKITLDPDVTYYEIDNRVTTTAAHVAPREIAMNREPGAKKLTIWGSIPADDAGWSQAIAIDDPAEYAANALREMLTKRGVAVHGKERVAHRFTSELPIYALDIKTAGEHGEHGGGAAAESQPAPARTVLARVSSRTLAEDVIVTNKVSQNLHAELQLREVGRRHGGETSLEAALAAEKKFLLSIGLEEDEFRLYDGSGMSTHNLTTPRALTKLLTWTQQQPWAEQFRASLPVGGYDGSLSDRFIQSVARGRVWAKTGTLTQTSCLSGFAETSSGRKLVFALLVNHHGLTGGNAKKVIDRVVELLVDDQTGRKRRSVDRSSVR